MLNAIPRRYADAELGLSRAAECLLCRTSDLIEREWVLCPLVGGKPICLGCCLDLQRLARAVDFYEDPWRDLFEEVARQTGLPVATLRLRCLEHQQEIVADELNSSLPTDDRDEILHLAFRISEAAREASGSP